VSKDEITFEILVESGAIEFAGVDEDGEMIYNFTNKLKDIAPELFDLHLNQLNSDIMHLWEKGFVTLNLLEDNPTAKLTEKAYDSFAIDTELDDHYRSTLKELKRIFSEQ